jgi:uncharacterized membrane protein
MNFTTPVALLLLLALPYFFWLGRPRPGAIRRRRDWASLGLRLLILLLLIFSLAGSQIVRAANELAVVFLVDVSDSINPQQRATAEEYVRQAIETMGPDDQAAVILFGANAVVERPMSGLAELAPITSVPQALHTDLAEAIRLGMALFPAGSSRRFVILSDGAATAGNTMEAARLAGAAGVEIDYVPIQSSVGVVEAWVTAVDAPTRVSEGETITVLVTAESTADMAATLRVLAGGQVIYNAAIQLRPGTNNFSIPLRATVQEFIRYTVEIVPDQDSYYQNNQLAAYTEVVGPPRVLVVASDGSIDESGNPVPDESPALILALQGAGLEVERTTPAGLSSSLPELSNYAGIVLVNVNAKNLSPRKMNALQSYVRDLGGGLVVVGGPQSYGMGGYFRTPLEETLPVEMQIKDQERFPAVSMAIVIDRSGSMGVQENGITKIQLADEAAARVVELLNDFDEITVIPVDTIPDNVIGPVQADDKAAIISEIRTIGAGGGGINVRTGLQAAAEAVAGSSNQVKHIIVLADGDDSNEQEGVPELIDALVAEGVTVTMVAIGQGKDVNWLRSMAQRGGGRFHLTEAAANLPQIFTQETTAIQRSYLIEERFFPNQASRNPILSGITAVPPLYGYVGTSSKATAQVVLETHLGDPLLAVWQYGLGRAVAWTSDAAGRWGTEWVRWAGFPTFWAQTVRWSIPPGRDNTVETVVQFEEQTARLMVDARGTDGALLNDLFMEANVVAPDGTVLPVTLAQTAPGRYETEFVPEAEGAYLIRVTGYNPEEEEAAIAQTTGWVLGYSPEYQQLEANLDLLQTLADITGGENLQDNPADVFAHTLAAEPTTRPIWPWLTLLAVLLLPVDIALRRLVISRRDVERAWAATFGRWRPARPEQAPERTQQVSRLFAAKKRASTTRPEGPALAQPAEKPAVEPPLPDPSPADSTPTRPEPEAPPTLPAEAPPPGSLAARLLEKRRQSGDDE